MNNNIFTEDDFIRIHKFIEMCLRQIRGDYIANKEYIKIFHFISLCMSGIILPSDWYSNHWNNLSIPKNSNIKLTSVDQLKELIHECLKSILGVGNY